MGLDSDIDEFAYSVTDLDQDGYLEIFVRFTGGTGHFTVYEIYEVDGDSGKLVRWKCEEEAAPDFSESPMRAFYDEKAGEWHLDVYDSLGQSVGEVGTTWYDLTLSGCGVQAQEYRSQMSELKKDNEFDFTYYGEKGEEISEAEYGKMAGKQYEGMKKAYISFADDYRMESGELEKMGRKQLLEELGHSLGEFAAEWAVDLTAWEAALPKEEIDCLRQIAREIPGLFYIDYDDCTNFLSFFVTDLDENGRPEVLLERSLGSGIVRSHMSCYELPEEGGGMRQAEMEDPECFYSYLGFGGEMEVIRDKKMGENQYIFDITGLNDSSYSKKSKCRMSLKDHRFSMREEKPSKVADGGGERDSGKEKKETVRAARMNVYGAPCEDYVYEKVFVSWLVWKERDG